MSDNELLELFTRVLRDLLLDDKPDLAMTTRRPDVDGWDSFMYVNFIVAIEQELGIRFNVAEVESFETVGDIVASVQMLLHSR